MGETLFYYSVGLVASSNSLTVKISDKINCFLAQEENWKFWTSALNASIFGRFVFIEAQRSPGDVAQR